MYSLFSLIYYSSINCRKQYFILIFFIKQQTDLIANIIKVPVVFEPMIYGSKGKALTHCCYVNDVGKKNTMYLKLEYTDEGNIDYINP